MAGTSNRRLVVVTPMVLAMASSAGWAAPGDIVFTDLLTNSVRLVESPGSVRTLVQIDDPDARIADIVRIGDTFYVGDGPRPETDPGRGRIFRMNGIFGSPVVDVISQGDPLQNPIGMCYDKRTDHLMIVNNPVSQSLPNNFDGIVAVPRTGGQAIKVYEEERPLPRPYYRSGVKIAEDPASDDFFVTTLNGGMYVGNEPDDFGFGSVIYRLRVDEALMTGEAEMLVDLSDTSVTGLDRPLTFTKGILPMADGRTLFVTDGGDGIEPDSGAIYRISLDEDGAFESIETFADGFGQMGLIVHNPYDDTLVFGAGDQRLMRIGLDGQGLELLAQD
ncbi:MAG: hypothetical protein KDA28_01120, partial [Phycisphaerales bacterium]|nr:hypothetical protein [Phycisphaerales bacterium]